MKANKANNRPIELIDEIKYHLLLWKRDADYKHQHNIIKKAVLYLEEAIKTVQTMADITNVDENKNYVTVKQFITVYNRKYLEFTDMECDEKFDGTTFVILKKVCDKLIEEGSNVIEFLNWVFDDYYKRPDMEKFLPPTLKFTIGNYTIKKFLFEFRDKLKIRKQDLNESEKRLKLMQVAVKLYKKLPDAELQKIIGKMAKNNIHLNKIFDFLTKFAIENKFDSIIKEIEDIKKLKVSQK